MKYVMFAKQLQEITLVYPVIFPDNLVHEDMAKALIAGPLVGFVVRSAGSVNSIEMPECYGESSTLGVGSLPDDSSVLSMQDYGGSVQ